MLAHVYVSFNFLPSIEIILVILISFLEQPQLRNSEQFLRSLTKRTKKMINNKCQFKNSALYTKFEYSPAPPKHVGEQDRESIKHLPSHDELCCKLI